MYAVARRPVCAVQNAVSFMPSGSNTRVLSTSANGCPAARAARTPSTEAPVLYIQRSPGWASSGRLPSPAIQVSGSGCTFGWGGPVVASRSLSASATTGHGPGVVNISRTMPKPNVNVSRSRAVIGRSAGTVSSSGPSILIRTLRSASSGSSRSTGSSRSSSPSPASARVAAAVIGFVVEAILNNESRATGAPPTDSVPSASTCTWSPLATSATSPGIRSSRRAGPPPHAVAAVRRRLAGQACRASPRRQRASIGGDRFIGTMAGHIG